MGRGGNGKKVEGFSPDVSPTIETRSVTEGLEAGYLAYASGYLKHAVDTS